MKNMTRVLTRLSLGFAMVVLGTTCVLAAGQTRYSYDALGRLVRVERPDGTILTYAYDPDGNITNRTVIHDADFDGTVDAADTCTDTDGDGFGDPGFPANTCPEDCAPADATAFATPAEVADLTITTIPGGFRLDWESQSSTAGSGTVYDVFDGAVSAMSPPGDFSSGECMADNLAATSYDDMSAGPAAGECIYYMLRAHNTCPAGMGTYGDVNRDTTAGASASACH